MRSFRNNFIFCRGDNDEQYFLDFQFFVKTLEIQKMLTARTPGQQNVMFSKTSWETARVARRSNPLRKY